MVKVVVGSDLEAKLLPRPHVTRLKLDSVLLPNSPDPDNLEQYY